jgi:uncharacterized protein (DUF1501 family)
VGAASVAEPLVTTRASFAASAATTSRTLIVVFMRGGADGLSVLTPTVPSLGGDYLAQVRPSLNGPTIPLPNQGGWAIPRQLQPLYDTLWATGELAFIPAVSAHGVTMSHFQAQQYLERGGATTGGWIARLLTQLGPGTDLRTVSIGEGTPTSVLGKVPTLTMESLANYDANANASLWTRQRKALRTLYSASRGALKQDVDTAINTLSTVERVIRTTRPRRAATYPSTRFGSALHDLATLLHANVGMRIATVDIGGWDTHSGQVASIGNRLSDLAHSLSAFMVDLGRPRRSRVTVAVMTEFGRRVTMNASGGTDHGHGGVMLVAGGGLRGSGVYGRWDGLSANLLTNGNVPEWNQSFDVLGELAVRRLGIGSPARAFPGHSYRPIGFLA